MRFAVVPVLSLFIVPGFLFGQDARPAPTVEELKSRPITTDKGKVGALLTQWWKEGTAAGNAGDFYDNRDGDHSPLNLGPWPQLQAIVYRPEEIKARLHWAGARVVRPGVVFGNSSTSAPPTMGGSNPRMYYVHPNGLDFLYKQYAGNNVYIYPEHRDHDPGHNGPDEGFGDLYPTNTPYLIISQGSSGSDQPFMRAIPYTLAAFRPDVKERLVKAGALMPTLQMILRSTSKALKDPSEYLTGKAHPTVFEGSNVDDHAMVRLAHSITAETLPPLVKIKVLKEDAAVHGRDFFEPGGSERLGDTPCVAARIWRGKEGKRRLTVSAAASEDLNKNKLEYHWVVLRGDPKRITIEPHKDNPAFADITVGYHERRPIAPGHPLESNRVDIGVFVHNGHYFSAPAFITFFSLDNEARTYDEGGRILEIGYGVHDTRVEVKDWPAFFAFLKEESPRRGLWVFAKDDLETLRETETLYAARLPDKKAADDEVKDEERRQRKTDKKRAELETTLKALLGKGEKEEAARIEKGLAEVQAELKKRSAIVQQARARLQKMNQELTQVVQQAPKGRKRSAQAIVAANLARMLDNPYFPVENAALIDEAIAKAPPFKQKTLKDARQRLVAFGVARAEKDGIVVTPLRADKAGPNWTDYERSLLRHATGLFLDGIHADFLHGRAGVNFVDQRLSAPRSWRDIYRYDVKGAYLGWTRRDDSGVAEFNRDGHLIKKKDDLGRCLEAHTAKYEIKGERFGPARPFVLHWSPGDETLRYEYDGPDDRGGRVAERK